MLCDSAQSIGGKLYVLGGGVNIFERPPHPLALALSVAVRLSVPWDLANHRLAITVRLLDVDGQVVTLGSGPVEARGQTEALRGPGLPHGFPLMSAFVLPLALPGLEPGHYVFELKVGDRIAATEPLLIR